MERAASLLHLIWAVPIGLAVSWVASFWMTLNWCGVSGCSGGGFGRISEPSLLNTLLGSALILVAWVALLWLAPWHTSHAVRVVVGLVVGLGFAIVLTLASTAGFVR